MTELFTNEGKIAVSVKFDTVYVELICGDNYAAQVLYEEIIERLQRGEGLTLQARQPDPLSHLKGEPRG